MTHACAFHETLLGLFRDYSLNGTCQLPFAALVEMALAAALRQAHTGGIGGSGGGGGGGGGGTEVVMYDVAMVDPLHTNSTNNVTVVCEVPGVDTDTDVAIVTPDGDRTLLLVDELEVSKVVSKVVDVPELLLPEVPEALSAAFSRCTEEVLGLKQR